MEGGCVFARWVSVLTAPYVHILWLKRCDHLVGLPPPKDPLSLWLYTIHPLYGEESPLISLWSRSKNTCFHTSGLKVCFFRIDFNPSLWPSDPKWPLCGRECCGQWTNMYWSSSLSVILERAMRKCLKLTLCLFGTKESLQEAKVYLEIFSLLFFAMECVCLSVFWLPKPPNPHYTHRIEDETNELPGWSCQ